MSYETKRDIFTCTLSKESTQINDLKKWFFKEAYLIILYKCLEIIFDHRDL